MGDVNKADREQQQSGEPSLKLDLEDAKSISSELSMESKHSALAQIISISILEFGVVLHRFVVYTMPSLGCV